jgi:hypothetical protein
MPDVETPAESSPAETTQTQTPKAEPVSVPTNAEEYAEWRLTGKLPDPQPSSKDPAPSKKPSVTPDSEPGAQHKRQGADARKEELNREIRDLIAKRDQLKQETEAPAKKDVKAEPSPAAEPEGPKRPIKPKQNDFKTWEEYETAKDKYDEDLADWKAGQKIQEYEQRRHQEAASQAMQVKLNEAKSRYGDEAEPKVLSTAKTVFDNQKVAPAIKAAIGRSDVLVDALYVMGSDSQELDSFIGLSIQDPLEALRKWYTVEALVKAELGKNGATKPESEETPERDENGKFISARPPARMPRQAPPPPTELGGNSSPGGDESDRALASGNVRKFFEERNRKDMARWKGN